MTGPRGLHSNAVSRALLEYAIRASADMPIADD